MNMYKKIVGSKNLECNEQIETAETKCFEMHKCETKIRVKIIKKEQEVSS